MPYQIEIRKKPFTSSRLKKLQFPSHIHPHLELIYLISPIIHRDRIPTDIAEQLTQIHQRLNAQDPFSQLSAKGKLLTLLCELLPSMELIDAPADQDCIKRLLIYCTEHYTEPISLELLAKELHLNKYYISHIFQEKMNISYKDFINRLRVEHACELLAKDVQITEVAYASGFSTIRTFNRAFLKYMGKTPREYVRDTIV